MRKIFGGVLVGLGGFLLIAAVLGTFWAPGVLKRTPIDVNTTTWLSGEAARLDTATGDFTKRPIWAKSVNQVDSEASTDDMAAFVTTSCAQFDVGQKKVCKKDVDDPVQIALDIDPFAMDRVTAMSLSGDGLPAGAAPHEGLVNKFPFDTEQKTYPYWDSTISRAVDAAYVGEEKLNGLDTYVFEVKVADEPIQIGDGIDGTYTDTKQIYVEPTTGSIVNQVDDQQRYLADGTQVLDLQLAFTDEYLATATDEAKSKASGLDLITGTLPLVGFIGGPILLVVGLLLMRRRSAEPGASHVEKVPVGAGR